MHKLLPLTLVGLTLTLGCASKTSTTGATPSPGSTVSSTGTDDGGGENVPVRDLPSFHLSDAEGPVIVDQELDIIPTEVNPAVDKWIRYFQGRGRPHMERYLARSTRYEKLMKRVLREEGLPEDLFYIALIESGFTSSAVSHASAVGYWQFIRGTGKRYGLEISKFTDERRDPVLATQAAAEYFKGLYSVFGSWYLAMASYNVGENRVKKEIMKHETRDFWELARKARFPSETINYIPKFIAAKMIGKEPAKYGFEDIDYLAPIEYDTVVLAQPVNMRVMAEKMNFNYEDFKALNPRYKGELAVLKDGKLDLRIPVGQSEVALQAAADSVPEKVEYVADGDTRAYKIRGGDNMSNLARRFRTSVAYLRDLNDLPRGKRLKLGMTIYVPDRTPLKDRSDRTGRNVRSVPKDNVAAGPVYEGSSRFHIVQSGDNLSTIAKRYRTSIEELTKINNIRKGNLLKAGVKLKIPGGGRSKGGNTDEDARETAGPTGQRSSKRTVHVVRRGENLSAIAEKYKVSIEDIQKHNKQLRNPSSLMAGIRLVIPN